MNIRVGQNKQTERKEPRERHKKQRPTLLHTQNPHKNTKFKAIIYIKRPGTEPCRNQACIWYTCIHSQAKQLDWQGLRRLNSEVKVS